MKRTKIILHLLTVFTLIFAMGLGAIAALSEVCCGRASGDPSSYRPFIYMAIGAVLAAILLQIAVIVLKNRNGQDATKEKQVVGFMVGMLALVAVAALLSNEPSGLMGLALMALLSLLVLVVRGVAGLLGGAGET